MRWTGGPTKQILTDTLHLGYPVASTSPWTGLALFWLGRSSSPRLYRAVAWMWLDAS